MTVKSLEKEVSALKKELEMTTAMYEARIIQKNEEILNCISQYEVLTNTLRDRSTCSICLEIYTNPHVILCENECFQNICLRCKHNAATVLVNAGQLRVAAGLRCPSCRTRALGFVPIGNQLRDLLNFVPRRCEHCNEMMHPDKNGESVVDVLMKHYKECQEMLVHCPNIPHGCLEKIKRSAVESHVNTQCKSVPCKGFVGFLYKDAESTSEMLITPRTAVSEGMTISSGVQKLGCTFVGTYPRMMRHYSLTCSRKETDKVYKDLRLLYDQFRISRITNLLANYEKKPEESTVDVTCTRLIGYIKSAIEKEASALDASEPGGSLRTAILIEDDGDDGSNENENENEAES